jgi:retron-type reverse transcriptase
MLKAGILSDGELQVTDGGSPQGNISSPILSNIYGHYVIDLWFEDVVKKHALGAAKLFRYCDDIVICCDDARDGERITRALKGRLAKYGLELNLEK